MSNIPSVHEGSKLWHSGSISFGIRLHRILVLGVKRVDNLIFSPLVSTKTVPELSTSRCPTDQHKLLYKNPLNSGDTWGLIFYSCFHLHRNQKLELVYIRVELGCWIRFWWRLRQLHPSIVALGPGSKIIINTRQGCCWLGRRGKFPHLQSPPRKWSKLWLLGLYQPLYYLHNTGEGPVAFLMP